MKPIGLSANTIFIREKRLAHPNHSCGRNLQVQTDELKWR